MRLVTLSRLLVSVVGIASAVSASTPAPAAATPIPTRPANSGRLEWIPHVGFDFEHFGETYRITDDAETVTVINDFGTVLGVTLRSSPRQESRFRLDSNVHLGKETRRFRVDFDGRLVRGANRFELDQEISWRSFQEGGEYSISSDHLNERAQLTWERKLGEHVSLRLRDRLDGTWYSEPDQYNLNQWTNEPRVDLRLRFRDFDEARVGVRVGHREVPDSMSLGYDRVVLDTSLNLLFGWTSSLDVSEQLERRTYDDISVRESSWSNRFDTRFEFSSGDRATFRLLHENEVVRYDTPDDLDFDFDWARTGFQVEVHRTPSLDFTVMPGYAFLRSTTAPEEEYAEIGIEFGMDLRLGTHTWISLSDEVGRRDYEISATTTTTDAAIDDVTAFEFDDLDTAFSDYLYNRVTLLMTSDLSRGVSFHLFANWQPEDHRLSRHDTDTRIVSGGLEYSF